ncbi:MAG: aminopeptidase [Cyclobacteriaceae bacterium]|nr:aminopeptidase [Cyclobacteriaceae bacterium]
MKNKNIFRSLYLVGAMSILGFLLFKMDFLTYIVRQGQGQFYILWNARPIELLMDQPETNDTLIAKFKLIADVKSFAIEELGMKSSNSYTSYFDQGGKPLMWVVTGCKPYAFEPKQWSFPIVGEVPYKGFFDRDLAQKELATVEAEGYESGLRTAAGWSTLGWFDDPILSEMLSGSTGDIVNLIIHELAHSTVFLESDVEFNENLATFIGDVGTLLYLEKKFGTKHDEYSGYLKAEKDYKSYVAHMLRGADGLDSLYFSFKEEWGEDKKRKLKEEFIKKITKFVDTLSLNKKEVYGTIFKEKLPNNTYFMSVKRYRTDQDDFYDTLQNLYHGNLKAYILYMKEKFETEE